MRCFGDSYQSLRASESLILSASLDDSTCQALANLIPLLGCGEEAAAAAFHRLANQGAFARATQAALHSIGEEEQIHEGLLAGLAAAMPPPEKADETRRAARRFHVSLTKGGPTLHLARIAAIDAAVCMILSRLTARSAKLATDVSVANVLRRIRNDEAKHVTIARTIGASSPDRARLREAGAQARVALSSLIASGGAAFEGLGVDPDRLVSDVARLPNGLL